MFFRAKRAIGRARFNRSCAALLKTAPVHSTEPSLALVSMLCHGEVRMYLLAVKSFCRQLGRNPQVFILNDGTLDQQDRALIAAHLPDSKIVEMSAVAPEEQCPKGGCWERLLLISDLSKDYYVLQLDSDTVTLASVPEIAQCIAMNRSFTLLGDRSFPEIESMASACARARGNESSMVQGICERSFDKLEESPTLKYVRGNAGFVGFALGSIDRTAVARFSRLMRRVAGNSWDQWGSEQVASNLLIANTPEALPLPFPKYLSHWNHPDVAYEQSSFIHFIGPFRFANGLYMRCARKVAEQLALG